MTSELNRAENRECGGRKKGEIGGGGGGAEGGS